MSDPFVLVTGATDGIGYETALGLLRAGRAVLVHGRTPTKAEAARSRLNGAVPGANTLAVAADFSRLDEVRSLGARIRSRREPLGGLIHNAGALFGQRLLTEDGWEATWQVNHLAPFLLQHLVQDLLVPGARVVWVSSQVHRSGSIPWDDFNGERSWDGFRAYSATKLANAQTAFRLARAFAPARLASHALHPGVVGTKLARAFGVGGISAVDGARTSLKAALDPALEGQTGLYLDGGRSVAASAAARDEDEQDRLWTWSVRSLAL